MIGALGLRSSSLSSKFSMPSSSILFFHVSYGDLYPHLISQQYYRILVQILIYIGHDAHLHQCHDDLRYRRLCLFSESRYCNRDVDEVPFLTGSGAASISGSGAGFGLLCFLFRTCFSKDLAGFIFFPPPLSSLENLSCSLSLSLFFLLIRSVGTRFLSHDFRCSAVLPCCRTLRSLLALVPVTSVASSLVSCGLPPCFLSLFLLSPRLFPSSPFWEALCSSFFFSASRLAASRLAAASSSSRFTSSAFLMTLSLLCLLGASVLFGSAFSAAGLAVGFAADPASATFVSAAFFSTGFSCAGAGFFSPTGFFSSGLAAAFFSARSFFSSVLSKALLQHRFRYDRLSFRRFHPALYFL